MVKFFIDIRKTGCNDLHVLPDSGPGARQRKLPVFNDRG
jgi:hypothetical protein